MGDDFKKVRAGDALRIPARFHNAAVDAVRAQAEGRALFRRENVPGQISSAVADAYNASGLAAPLHAVVELIVAGATQEQIEFAQPGHASGSGYYGIALESIPAGVIGRIAIAAGPWPILVDSGCEVGDTLGPKDGQWTADPGETAAWEVLRRDLSGIAQVRFLGGAIAGDFLIDIRTDDPGSPAEGYCWIRSDLL